MTLTPTQRAICAVIRENGGWASFRAHDKLFELCAHGVGHPNSNGGVVWVDGHKITKEQYDEFKKSQSTTPPRP